MLAEKPRRNRMARHGGRAALFAALGVILGVTIGSARGETVAGRTIRVIDGDTVALASGERIRLIGIDAPEIGRARCWRERRIAVRASARLAHHLRQGPVTIRRCDGSRCQDRYRRTLADLTLSDGRDAGRVLIREGLALPYRAGRLRERQAHWCGR